MKLLVDTVMKPSMPGRLVRLLCFLAVCLIRAHALLAQSSGEIPTFKAKARSVVVDVTAYDGNGYTSRGEPMHALRKEDFEVYEQGRRQKVSFFEEHHGPADGATQAKAPAAGTWTNAPTSTSNSSVTVILIDPANIALEDQSWMFQQVIRYFRSAPSGHPIALLALAPDLKILHDFTTEPALLLDALSKTSAGTRPFLSPFAQSESEANLAQRTAEMERQATGQQQSGFAKMAEQTERMQSEFSNLALQQSTGSTLSAFSAIARYLAAIPGRKNLIWISKSFTEEPFGSELDFSEQVKEASNLLAESRVAVYPIDGSGLSAGFEAAASLVGPTIKDGATATTAQNHQMFASALKRNGDHQTMDDIAERTGGEAYYNTNGITWAIDRIVRGGETYYSLGYTPDNDAFDGSYRRIRVVLRDHSRLTTRLAYRRGYYADDRANPAPLSSSADPLFKLMSPGMPNATQLVFSIKVHPLDAPGDDRAGDNDKLQGPTIRYAASIVVPLGELAMRQDAGLPPVTHGDLQLELVAYNDKGEAVNWAIRRLLPDFGKGAAARFEGSGLRLTQNLDLPPGAVSLRAGLYDRNADRAGTVQVALGVVPVTP